MSGASEDVALRILLAEEGAHAEGYEQGYLDGQVEALQEAAAEVERLAQGLPSGYGPTDDSVATWLRDRADRIADPPS